MNRPIEALIIEDNQADIDLMREALNQHKMLVNLHVAFTGEQGLQFLRGQGQYKGAVKPDLILLDLNLPGLDGREVLKEIKNDSLLQLIPVVILTSSEAELDVIKTYSMGANCYIVKPVDFSRFSQVVMSIENFWFSIVKLPAEELASKYRHFSPALTLPIKASESYERNRSQLIRVLLIEDSEPDTDLVREFLKSQSEPTFFLTSVTNLKDAIEQISIHQLDVVLLDLSLPDSHGFETIQNITQKFPDLPIVVLTGFDDKSFGVRAVNEGAQDFLTKGKINSEILSRVILYSVERKAIELKLNQTLIQEHSAREEAERAVGIRDEFFSIASHELKTPLTSLKLQLSLFSRLLKSGESLETVSDRLIKMGKSAENQIDKFSKLVETLLDFSRIQSGRLELDLSQFDLCNLAREVCSTLAPTIEQANCTLKLEAKQPIIGNWDSFRIEQILVNLITNATKYAQGKPIEVTLNSDADSAWIRVKDYGSGIAHEDQERIFRRFERAVGKSNVSGLGLGLYIVRQIVNAHGGSIRVESTLNKGSVFILNLPIAAAGVNSLTTSIRPENGSKTSQFN